MNTVMIVKPESSEYPFTSESASPDITGMLDHMAHAHVLKESSLAMYRRDFAAYMEYVNKHGYSPVDPTTLENWRDDLINEGKSPNTINRELAAVKRVMKEAAKPRHRLISTSAAYEFEHIDGASIDVLSDRLKQTKSLPLRKSQMQRVCNLPDESTLLGLRDKALLYTLATSGIRASELAGLLVSRVLPVDGGISFR